MILAMASSTARVTDRHSGSGKPIFSVSRSIAPRTAQSKSGLLRSSSFNSMSRCFKGLNCLPAQTRKLESGLTARPYHNTAIFVPAERRTRKPWPKEGAYVKKVDAPLGLFGEFRCRPPQLGPPPDARRSRLRRQRAERRESWRRIQAGSEIANKRFHSGMPEAVEAEEIHFFYRPIGRPLVHGHTIDGGENAGTIVAEVAVHEDFLPRIVAEKREKMRDLFVGWRVPAADGNVYKAHSHGFGVLALPEDFFAILAA